jgi:hypothetical protein
MPSFAPLAWNFVRAACLPAARQFAHALTRVRSSQLHLLRDILRNNRQTEFGRRHDFVALRNWDDFRARVPLQTAADYQRTVQRIAAGEPNLLNPQPPRFFGLTSGLSGEPKLIAHPPSGLTAFGRAGRVWLSDLLGAWPAIRRGRAYLSISPPLAGPARLAPGGIPIGMAAPSRHFARWGEAAFARISITSPGFDAEPAWSADIPGWRRATASLLAAADDLSLLALANPGFFEMLWRTLLEHRESILGEIHDGQAYPGMSRIAAAPARAAQLARLLAHPEVGPAACWPQLAMISCWGHAASAEPARMLAAQWPGVPLQAKGLWATEAPVSIPLAAYPWPVLAVNCACYEFIADDGSAYLADEVRIGGEYRVVLTTAGGLYRYELGDRVAIRGFAGTAPLLELLGRTGIVADLAGEKLAESFVAQCLPTGIGFRLLLPAVGRRRYQLVVDAPRHDNASAQALAATTEQALCRHWLYADRRSLGLLEAVAAMRVHQPAGVLDRLFLAQGRRGDGGKPLALALAPDWLNAFEAALA